MKILLASIYSFILFFSGNCIIDTVLTSSTSKRPEKVFRILLLKLAALSILTHAYVHTYVHTCLHNVHFSSFTHTVIRQCFAFETRPRPIPTSTVAYFCLFIIIIDNSYNNNNHINNNASHRKSALMKNSC